jgi:hypothetical protein
LWPYLSRSTQANFLNCRRWVKLKPLPGAVKL